MEKIVTVSELCDLLGVSKSRLYTLIHSGILPEPKRNPSNNRPVFESETVEKCLEVMRTHIGVNGLPYTPNKKRKKSGVEPKKKDDPNEARSIALSAFGVAATSKQIEAALKTLPPTAHTEEEILKHLVLQLRNQA
jgi:hypothetical protein